MKQVQLAISNKAVPRVGGSYHWHTGHLPPTLLLLATLIKRVTPSTPEKDDFDATDRHVLDHYDISTTFPAEASQAEYWNTIREARKMVGTVYCGL